MARRSDLRQALREFAELPTPRALLGLIAAGTTARMLVGRPGWPDAVVLGATVIGYSPGEWVAHNYVLHSGEFMVGSTTRQLGVARNHAAHHLDPSNTDKAALDSIRNLATAIAGGTAALAVPLRLVGGPRTSAAAITAGTAMVAAILWYETHHHLIHAGYCGTSSRFRNCRKVHLAHHHRDETRSFGVGSTWCDRMLGTA